MDCGHTWVMLHDKETCVCPHCHAKLTVKATTQRVMRERGYFTILTTCGAYQVLRMFLLDVSFEKGCKPSIQTYEIGAYWWNDDGQKCVMAVRKCMGYYIDTFSFASPIAVRNDNNAYQYVAGSYLYPKHQVIDIVRRNGFDGNLHGIPTHDFISAILTDNRYETMLKVGQYELVKYCLINHFPLDDFWHTIKICIRHNYIIRDVEVWKDYVSMLVNLGKDIRNPRWVCPDDLNKVHDTIMKQYHKKRNLERQKEERKRIRSLENNYHHAKSRFFGLVFSDSLIQVKVLESVNDFWEEGQAMHHCVYAGSYYDRQDALIFSATIAGQRVETVEVSLSKLEVVQSRGICNQNTEYHDRIISLVNKNMELIRQRI